MHEVVQGLQADFHIDLLATVKREKKKIDSFSKINCETFIS